MEMDEKEKQMNNASDKTTELYPKIESFKEYYTGKMHVEITV